MHDHLNRLAMQGKLTLGGLLQLIASRPCAMSSTCSFVDPHAEVPHLRGFHLGRFQASEERRGRVQSIHTHGLHAMILAW
jgi:hypothetical protein